MAAIEEEALHDGVSLLILDTRMGDPSQQLYEKIGSILAGILPHYARGTTGALEPISMRGRQSNGANMSEPHNQLALDHSPGIEKSARRALCSGTF
jgi:hypothetical protein